MMFEVSLILFLFAIPVAANTNFTPCNPTTNTCQPVPAYSSPTTYIDFTKPYAEGQFTWFSENTITQDQSGLHITINKLGEEPFIVTDNYIFYGRVTATIKTTNATTISTYFNLQADDTDEIDWQINGNATTASALYYSRGSMNIPVTPNAFEVASPHLTFHDYTIDWNEDKIEWIIDGVTLATITSAAAGSQYPQLPVRISVGIWCPECSGSLTSEVGTTVTTDLDSYVVTLTSLNVTNYNPATEYSYGNMSGSASSVVIVHSSPSSSKISGGLIAGVVVAGLACIIGLVGLVIYYLQHRRAKSSTIQDDQGNNMRTSNAEVSAASRLDNHNPPVSLQYPKDENTPIPTLNFARDHMNQTLEFQTEKYGSPSSDTGIGGINRAGGRLGTAPETLDWGVQANS